LEPIFYTKKPAVFSTVYDYWKLKLKANFLYKTEKFKLVHCRSYIPSMIGLRMQEKYNVKFLFDMRGFWADERVDGGLWDLDKIIYRQVYKFFKSKEKAFLEEGFQTFESHRENYNRFKKFHSLQELPKNADPAETKFQFFALFLLLIIEIIVNGMLLSGGGESTIGQSASVATIQSIINVIGCYFVGKILWGNIKYAESIANKIGLISLFSGIFYFIILLNINMGLFREHIVKTGQDQYGAVSLEVGAGLWQWMPFPLELSPQSQMAVAVGMVFAFLAFLDGMKSDDLYPGYGDVYRGALKHKKKIGNKIRSINLAWNDALKKFNIKQSTSGEKGTQSIKEWSDETNTIEQVWVDYKNNLEALEAIYDKAIKLYVTNYNKFHNESSLRLQADLFTKNELDLKVQFSDIAQYYLDDNSREKEEANRKKIFAKEFSELKKELASINEKITTEIKLLSEKYACKLN